MQAEAMRFIRLIVLLISAALTPSAACAEAPAQVEAEPDLQHVTLSAPDGRAIDLSVWAARDEKGVVVFSHGYNATPGVYGRIVGAWRAHGYTVVAPLHVDSLQHPQHAQFDNAAAFGARIVDLAVARGWIRGTRPGRPIVAAGHSFGSLMSVIEGGALTPAGPQGDPGIAGVIAISSAGDIPGVISTDSYRTLDKPLLAITGDRDLVTGYVTEWRGHRGPFDRSPAGDKMLMVFEGGDHEFIGNADAADFAVMVQATTDFMDAYALNDPAARARLAALRAEGVAIERR